MPPLNEITASYEHRVMIWTIISFRDPIDDPVFNPNWSDEAKSLWKIYQDVPRLLSSEHFWTEDEVVLETNKLAEQLAALK